jgi:hypothetical protein
MYGRHELASSCTNAFGTRKRLLLKDFRFKTFFEIFVTVMALLVLKELVRGVYPSYRVETAKILGPDFLNQ